MRLSLPRPVAAGPAALQAEFTRVSQPFRWPAGRQVLAPGDLCSVMAFVTEGSVRAYLLGADGREVTLYRVRDGHGCVLSASCLLGRTPFPASAATEATTAGWAVPAEAFREWMDRHRYWRNYVFGLIGERLAAVLGRFEEVAFQRLDTRLARLLLSRTEPTASALRITQTQLADELGSAREVISRALGRWRAAGVVRSARGEIRILDRTRLGQLAGTA